MPKLTLLSVAVIVALTALSCSDDDKYYGLSSFELRKIFLCGKVKRDGVVQNGPAYFRIAFEYRTSQSAGVVDGPHFTYDSGKREPGFVNLDANGEGCVEFTANVSSRGAVSVKQENFKIHFITATLADGEVIYGAVKEHGVYDLEISPRPSIGTATTFSVDLKADFDNNLYNADSDPGRIVRSKKQQKPSFLREEEV